MSLKNEKKLEDTRLNVYKGADIEFKPMLDDNGDFSVVIEFKQFMSLTEKFRIKLQDYNVLINREKRLIAELEEKAKTYKVVIANQDFDKIPDLNINKTLIDKLNKIGDIMPWKKIHYLINLFKILD
eukprot:CAMPEP_0116981050 /NCGR_PEP_ID=MMETSP0467-20121206/59451_1 /TAXON_ID=283647 /ORGANISM="Mesodinium pulex, Strain SPMC105" /LENGTH=126 /DNA_ID=CAMNT_0004675147 /DNA_START=482 /DNA_END=862 /DNA_ORIENTATION=-